MPIGTVVHDTTEIFGPTGAPISSSILAGNTVTYQRYDIVFPNSHPCPSTGNHVDEQLTIPELTTGGSSIIPPSTDFTLNSPGTFSYGVKYDDDVWPNVHCESLQVVVPITTAVKDKHGQDFTGITVPFGTMLKDTAKITTGSAGIPADSSITYQRFKNGRL